ncbi:MAG: hypothetical protein EBQ92_02435, partial [Proteobacteria bacterium]|nr:hypothetical protein [Pseudomonadota bacterium]
GNKYYYVAIQNNLGTWSTIRSIYISKQSAPLPSPSPTSQPSPYKTSPLVLAKVWSTGYGTAATLNCYTIDGYDPHSSRNAWYNALFKGLDGLTWFGYLGSSTTAGLPIRAGDLSGLIGNVFGWVDRNKSDIFSSQTVKYIVITSASVNSTDINITTPANINDDLIVDPNITMGQIKAGIIPGTGTPCAPKIGGSAEITVLGSVQSNYDTGARRDVASTYDIIKTRAEDGGILLVSNIRSSYGNYIGDISVSNMVTQASPGTRDLNTLIQKALNNTNSFIYNVNLNNLYLTVRLASTMNNCYNASSGEVMGIYVYTK